jgi:hypothetical protein
MRDRRRLYKTRRSWRMIGGGLALVLLVPAAALSVKRDWIPALSGPLLLARLEAEGWPRPKTTTRRDAAGAPVPGLASAPQWVRGVAERRMLQHWLLDYRPTWPAGVPIAVRLAPTASSIGRDFDYVDARLLDTPGDTASWVELEPRTIMGTTGGPLPWYDRFVELGSLPAGRHEMRLELKMSRCTLAGEVPVWTGTVVYPIEIVAHEVITPVADPRIAQDLFDGFQEYEYRYSSNTARDFVLRLTGVAAAKGITTAVKVEVLRNGEPVAACRVWDGESLYGTSLQGPGGAQLPLNGDRWAVQAIDLASPIWSIRITADPELALRDLANARYWSGTVVITGQAQKVVTRRALAR